jgi:hypothetical protein
MKILAEKQALKRLGEVKAAFTETIRRDYEHRARSCTACPTPGACCLDEHFVNVRITRLEAVSIRQVLEGFSEEKQAEIYARVDSAIEKYGLSGDGENDRTYACPMFEKGTGCLVHNQGKPLPCIQHACYENAEDLPPDELLDEHEGMVDRLNRRTYGETTTWQPLPVAVRSGTDR